MRYRTEGVHKVFGRSGGGKARFRQRTGSTGLFEDKNWCRMCDDERCVLCNSGEVEDVEHFLVRCEEFRWESSHTSFRINNPPWASVKIS